MRHKFTIATQAIIATCLSTPRSWLPNHKLATATQAIIATALVVLTAVEVSLAVFMSPALPISAGSLEQTSTCRFILGFKALHDAIPAIVGDCLRNEWYSTMNGNALQETTAYHGKGGLLVWRRADNWTAFTDGASTWVNGPYGIQKRLNSERLPWENDPVEAPAPMPSPTPAALPPVPSIGLPPVLYPFPLLPLPSIGLMPVGAAEWVGLVKVVNYDHLLVVRRNGETWLLEHGIGCLSIGLYEGRSILVYSPGLFAGTGSSIILPDSSQQCQVWNATSIW